jgi:hypothetical protein
VPFVVHGLLAYLACALHVHIYMYLNSGLVMVDLQVRAYGLIEAFQPWLHTCGALTNTLDALSMAKALQSGAVGSINASALSAAAITSASVNDLVGQIVTHVFTTLESKRQTAWQGAFLAGKCATTFKIQIQIQIQIITCCFNTAIYGHDVALSHHLLQNPRLQQLRTVCTH